MKIRIDGEMLAAMRAGEDTYTPIFGNEELDLERGDSRVTLENLRKITSQGRRAIGFYACSQHVLVIFDTGETYLATGFGYGNKQEEVQRFADFASSQGFGDRRSVLALFSSIKDDGPIDIKPSSHSDLSWDRPVVETVPHPALDK